ncbi:MAG: hypothetical protein KAX49_12575 [Halanaerobiales bacterium]|nr:hypothetical protein [Halanaerobiales bacterium]
MRIRSKIIFNMEHTEAKVILEPLGLKIREDILQAVEIFTDTEKYHILMGKIFKK